MRFEFKDKKLEKLYTSEEGARRFPPGVVDSFFEVMATISGIQDVRELYNLKGLRFKKLKRNRNLHSLRLNQQYRLIVTLHQVTQGHIMHILQIDDHQDDK